MRHIIGNQYNNQNKTYKYVSLIYLINNLDILHASKVHVLCFTVCLILNYYFTFLEIN